MKESISEKMSSATGGTNRNNLGRLLENSIIGTILDSEIAMIHIVNPDGVILKNKTIRCLKIQPDTVTGNRLEGF